MNKRLLPIILFMITISPVFAQFTVKNSDNTTVMTVDRDGNANIIGKTTTANLAITANTPLQGKVPFTIDNTGNLRWSAQPTATGQYLSWNHTTHQWDVAEPPVGTPGPPGPPGQGLSGGEPTRVAFWTGESSMGHDGLLYWDDTNNRLGVGTGTPTARLHVNGTVRLQGLTSGTQTSVLVADGNGNLHTRTLSDWTDNDNQGLTVGAGATNTSIIDISGSSSDVTLTAGTGIGISESGNNITITNTNPGGATYWQRNSGNLAPATLSDNVGIGTSSPSTKFHVNGSLRFQGLGTNTANTNVLTTDGNGNVTTRTLSDWTDDVNDADHVIGNEYQDLSVGAGSASTSVINLSNSSNAVTLQEGIGIQLTESGNTITITNTQNGVTGTGAATRVAFWNSSTALGSDANLYWDNNNNRLGIGTSSPSYVLDVRGATRVTGATSLQNTLGVTGLTTLTTLAGTGNRTVYADAAGTLRAINVVPGGSVYLQPTTAVTNAYYSAGDDERHFRGLLGMRVRSGNNIFINLLRISQNAGRSNTNTTTSGTHVMDLVKLAVNNAPTGTFTQINHDALAGGSCSWSSTPSGGNWNCVITATTTNVDASFTAGSVNVGNEYYLAVEYRDRITACGGGFGNCGVEATGSVYYEFLRELP
ncbi:hypothetical protein GF406_22165 [candidate division KSB1 bacterium]|nr:hypothetical protein [candidate division KSB1 bacterium]